MLVSIHTDALARFRQALSDPTRTRVLLALREGPAYPSDLADLAGVSRQAMSNCLRGCGPVVAVRRSNGSTAPSPTAGPTPATTPQKLHAAPYCPAGSTSTITTEPTPPSEASHPSAD